MMRIRIFLSIILLLFSGCQKYTGNCLYPEQFNAKGDGLHDDTEAFRKLAAFANKRESMQGCLIVLKPGGKYILSGKVLLDMNKIKGVEGNNGYIILTSDSSGLVISGHKKFASVAPTIVENQELCEKEFAPYITKLQVYSKNIIKKDRYIGTGLSITGTVGLIISGCHFFHLRTAIELKGINRNIIISQNSIWDCYDYGIHWNRGNLHQQIISGNHISYMKKCLFFDNVNGHNIHINGNDIEGGAGGHDGLQTLVHFLVNSENADMSQIQINGNSIEEHFEATGPLIKFENKISNETGYNKLRIIEITGNEFSGSRNNAVEMENVTRMSINGNSFTGLGGYGLVFSDCIKSLSCCGNTFTGNLKRPDRLTDGIFISCDTLSDFVFHGNVCSELHNCAFKVVSLNLEKPVYLKRINISDNIFSLVRTQKRGAGLNEYFIDISLTEPGSHIQSFIVKNNQISGGFACKGGVRIACKDISYVVLKNNLTLGITGRKYDFPSKRTGNILIADNL